MQVSQPLKRAGRRAALTIEVLLIMPVLLMVLLAVVEFSLLIVAGQRLADASARGARAAAQGASLPEIRKVVQISLGKGNLSAAKVSAFVPPHAGQPVEVVVQLPAAQAVPDLLSFVGFSIKNTNLSRRTSLPKE
jgi:Flp pilus assembly protein TadG